MAGTDLSNNIDLETFRWMLNFDSTRGEDSTGVAIKRVKLSNNRGRVDLRKTEGAPGNLFARNPGFFNTLGRIEAPLGERIEFIIGHNRAASVGGPGVMNAHPFRQGNIVGAHNGTINQGLFQLPHVQGDLQGTTDSEKMFHALSKDWPLQKVVNTVTGALALTWYDDKTNTINLYRNKERPLFFVFDQPYGKLAWASEEWMLKLAARQGKCTWIKPEMVTSLDENKHLTFKLSKTTGRIESMTVEVVEKEVVAATPAADNFQQRGALTVPGVSRLVGHGREVPHAVVPFRRQGSKRLGIEDGWYIHSSPVTAALFADLSHGGCACCGADLNFEDCTNGRIKWANKLLPVCHSCALEFEMLES
jgi:hypothetical protein